MTPQEAFVYEVFTSIQGEGVYLGCPQTFVRLAGCDFGCAYCDTPAAADAEPPSCRLEATAGCGDFEIVTNPLGAGAVVDAVARIARSRAVSITGGEPLLQAGFLMTLLPLLRVGGFRVHLETNGTLPDAMRKVAPHVDVVAMDVKLPSSTGGADCFAAHEEFVDAARGVELFVKVVVTEAVTDDEIRQTGVLAAALGKSTPLVIQPVTPTIGGREAPPTARLLELHRIATGMLDDVRIIPQMHKLAGIR